MSPLLLLAALAASVSGLPALDFQALIQAQIQNQLQQFQQTGQVPLPLQFLLNNLGNSGDTTSTGTSSTPPLAGLLQGLLANAPVAPSGRSVDGETKKHWGGHGGYGKWNNWNKPSYGNYGNYGNYNPFAAYYNPYAAYGGVPYTGTIGTITGATSAA